MDPISDILKREGWPAYTNRPEDRGGPTKGGITLKTYAAYLGRPVTIAQLQALEEPTARKIYEFTFIVQPGFGAIRDRRVRDYLIDIGVTSGPARSIRYLQRAVGGLTVDGVLGPKTAAAANAVDPTALLLRLVAIRCRMMAADVQDNPDQLPNIEGWITRAVQPLEQFVLKPTN